jgi:thioredoxin 1
MIEVNQDNFSEEVLNSENPVLVDIWGPTCQPCLKLMPHVEELASSLEGKVKVVKINSKDNRPLCLKLGVVGLPSFLLFENGKEKARLNGKEVDMISIEQLVNENM